MRGRAAYRRRAWLGATALSPALLAAIHSATVSATTLTWDPLQTTAGSDGSGNWDTTDKFWSNGSADSTWTNGAGAIFGSNIGPAGTVTLTTPITANGLTFNNAASGNYTIAAAAPGDVLTIPNSAPITVAAGLSPTISAPIAVSASNGMFFNGPGTLNISGASTYSIGNSINSGTVTVQPGGNLGSANNSIMIGTFDGPSVATLILNTNLTAGGFIVGTNVAAANTLNISSGQTMTVTSTVNIGLNPGGAGSATTTELTTTGGGNLAANLGGASFTVGIGSSGTHGNTTTADLSGLNSFTCTAATGTFALGAGNLDQATLTLAATNTITAGKFNVGTGAATGFAGSGKINLGSGTTTFNSSSISIGADASSATIDWLPATTTGSLVSAGTTGGASRSAITIASRSETGGAAPATTLSLDGHSVNILASTLILGSNTNTSSVSGSIAFDTGTLDATTLDMAASSGAGASSATLTIGSSPTSTGSLIVNSGTGGFFSLADNEGTALSIPPLCSGELDIKGGSAQINCDITVDTAHGGTGSAAGTILLEGGTLNMMGHNIGGTGRDSVALTTTSGTLENVNTINNIGGVLMTGSGLLTIDGTNNYTGPTSTTGGTLTLTSTGSIASTLITVAPGAQMNLNGTFPSTATLTADGNVTFGANTSTGFFPRTLAALFIGTGNTLKILPPSAPANRTVLSTPPPTFSDNTGTLDLSSNDLILKNAGPTGFTTAVSQITQARNTGALGPWTGAGITSSSAAATPATTALAVERNDNGSGVPLMTSFDGQTVGDADVLVKYTFVGDADLSGHINAADYTLIDNGFNSQTTAHPLTGWRNGDFNYDGHIDGDDYTLIDNAFNTQGTTSYAAAPASPAEMIALDTAQVAATSVPEPASLLLLSIGAALLHRRRST